MKSGTIQKLQRLQGWRLSLIIVLATIVATEVSVAVVEWILKGEVTADFLLTGFFVDGIVAPVFVAILSRLLTESTRLQRESLANSVFRAEAMLQMALEATRVICWELDIRRDALKYDAGLLPLLGLDADAAPASLGSWLQRVHPEDRKPFIDRYQAALQAGDPIFEFEYRMESQAGRWMWIHTHGRVVRRDAQGQPELAVGTSMNITARKEVERALAEREAQLRTLVEAVPDSVQFKDGQGRWLVANNVCLRLFGLEGADWQGLTDAEIARRHPQLADGLVSCQLSDESAWAAGEPFRTEEHMQDGGHRDMDFDVVKVPLFDETGGRRALVVIGRDITARKQSEAALAESHKLLQAIIDTAPIRVFWKDRNLRYLGCNPAFARDAGKSCPEDVIGHDDFELAWAEQAEIYRADDRRVIETGTAKLFYEEPQTTPEGEAIWLRTSKVPLRNRRNETIGVLGIYEDITAHRRAEEDLRDSETRSRELASLLRMMCDNVPDMIWAKDLDNRYLFANKAMCDQLLLARGTDEPVGRTDLFFADRERQSHPDDPKWHTFGELCQDTDKITLERGEPSVFEEFGNVRGQFLFLDVHKAPFCDADGRIIGTVGSGRDITVRKEAEQQLHLAASVFTHAREGIMITTSDATVIDVNEAFTRITGYGREEALGRKPSFLRSGRQDDAFYAAMWRDLTEKGRWHGEIWNRGKSGRDFAALETISAVPDAEGKTQHYVALISDITALKEHEKQLEHIAHYDALTNLPNRVLLADRLHQAMAMAERRGERLAVVYLDLDGFKVINDRHGHDAGDQVLKTVAIRMKQALRESDTLARLGGDEFVAVLQDQADMATSLPLLSRLLAAAAEPVEVKDLVLQVSASLGVTFYPQREEADADHLLRQADQAMYQAKLAGKNRYHLFDAEMDRSVRGRHESLRRFRQALERREFVLHYQPKVNMRTGAVIGAEALIRWQHPQEGLLPPASFLPVIENHPLSVELGEWVIDSALGQMERWQAAGLNLQVSVNLSAYHLQQPDFVDRLGAILRAHPGVAPSRFSLEVLETSALEDVFQTSKAIEACRQMGVQFALDDFGTGYSSLTYLKRLPVAEIKIDQSFIRDMLDDADDLSIVKGVLSLAVAFGRRIVAEGVETVGQGTILEDLGCDLAQGFGIARPMPAEAMPAWVADWRPDPAWNRPAGHA